MLLSKKTSTLKGDNVQQEMPNVLTTQRDESLDALRGFAILTMILSGSIAFGGVLPDWMYHAQVPPPAHKFDPTIAGITWVDLVFPFFLFTMGAAIPLALQRVERTGGTFLQVLWIASRRFILLTFFALFIYHMRAWVIAENPTTGSYLLSILGFGLLCLQFYEYKGERFKKFVYRTKNRRIYYSRCLALPVAV